MEILFLYLRGLCVCVWGGLGCRGREGFLFYIYNYNEMKIYNTGIINLDFLYEIILNVNSLFKNNEYLRVYISYKLTNNTLQSQSMNCGQIICKIYNWFSWGLIVKEAPDNILYHLSFKKNKTPLCQN